jgi:hypothetical protein
MALFSKRIGRTIEEKEITVREDAPIAFREFLVMVVLDLGYEPSFLRDIICRFLKVAPNRNNWSEYPNINGEVLNLITGCEWYFVYDIIEILSQRLRGEQKAQFASEINDYFKVNGIGWKLENDVIETRGNEAFETSLKNVVAVLEEAKLQTAKTEIREAITDLSRRPEPDITGAIQHSLACLECVCREATGNKKATLGELMSKAGNIVPKPLDQAISYIWGFTSEQGRHLREGRNPGYLEAELVVEVSVAISTYLSKKMTGVDFPKEEAKDDLPI